MILGLANLMVIWHPLPVAVTRDYVHFEQGISIPHLLLGGGRSQAFLLNTPRARLGQLQTDNGRDGEFLGGNFMENLTGLTPQTGIIGTTTKESFGGGLSKGAVPSNHI